MRKGREGLLSVFIVFYCFFWVKGEGEFTLRSSSVDHALLTYVAYALAFNL